MTNTKVYSNAKDIPQQTTRNPLEVYQWIVSQDPKYRINPIGRKNNHCQVFAKKLRAFLGHEDYNSSVGSGSFIMEKEHESISVPNCSLVSDLIDTNGTSNTLNKEDRQSGETYGKKLEMDKALFQSIKSKDNSVIKQTLNNSD